VGMTHLCRSYGFAFDRFPQLDIPREVNRLVARVARAR
jgi:hypothetical protein